MDLVKELSRGASHAPLIVTTALVVKCTEEVKFFFMLRGSSPDLRGFFQRRTEQRSPQMFEWRYLLLK